MVGGFLALILGVVVARQAMHAVGHPSVHWALAGVILLLGLYQSLLGLGLLHRIGLFSAS
jgi:hypothetical protein